ncbi:MAG: TlpA disulfide reductase family protein [Bacteroidota bacterium]
MKFRFYFVLSLLSTLSAFSQTPITIVVRNGNAPAKAYLAEFHYYEYKIVDSAAFQDKKYVFNTKGLKNGIYRVFYNDTVSTDVLYENDTVQLEIQNLKTSLHPYVEKGFSNQLYYDYLYLRDSLIGNNHADTLSSLPSFNMNDFSFAIISSLLQIYSKTWPHKLGTRIVNAMQLPRYSDWLRLNPGKSYPDLRAFYKDHFFDNIDFNDTALYNTEVLYRTLKAYFTGIVQPRNTETFNAACDFVVGKAGNCIGMKCYIINTLIDVFSNTLYQDVAVYLFENHYMKNPSCLVPGHKRESLSFDIPQQMSAPGTLISDIILPDTNGVSKNIFSVKSKNTLLLFWSPDCDQCKEDLAKLLKLSGMYKPKDFSVFAVALSDDMNGVKKEARLFPVQWQVVSDMKGLASPMVQKFNILFTPAFYLLDENKKIIVHTYKLEDVNRAVNKRMMK